MSFIPTRTDTGVHRSAHVFAVCLCILSLCILGIHELCLEKIWLYNLPSERVDAGSCVTHIKL